MGLKSRGYWTVSEICRRYLSKQMNATMEADPTKAYNQDDATGFIRLNALRLKVAAKVQRKGRTT